MDTIEAVYVINLDRRPERWRRVEAAIRRAGGFGAAPIHRFSAVDGQRTDVQQAYQTFPLRQKFSAGAYGCTRSHMEVYRLALRQGYQRIVVLEDDATFHLQFPAVLRRLMERAPSGWQLLLFGYGVGRWRPPFDVTKALPATLWYALEKPPLGSFAYAIGREAMQYMASRPVTQLMPFDVGGLLHLARTFPGKCWCPSWPHPIIQPVATSDTDGSAPSSRRNRAEESLYYQRSGWNKSEYDYYHDDPISALAAAATALPQVVVETVPADRRTDDGSRVHVHVQGGLGNQLFILAAGLAYARQYGRRLAIVPAARYHQRAGYWTTVLASWTRSDTAPEGVVVAAPGASAGSRTVKETGFSYRALPPPSPGVSVLLDGYFQSLRYFETIRDEVVQSLMPRAGTLLEKEVSQSYTSLGGEAGTTYVSIHVRRGDYRQYPLKHPVLPLTYYRDCVRRGGWQVSSTILVVFSDALEECRREFQSQFEGFRVVYAPASLADEVSFFLMARCTGGHIIANSTFSWWAALVGQCASPRPVWAPTPWFGPAGPQDTQDLIPPQWTKVSWTCPANHAGTPRTPVNRTAAPIASRSLSRPAVTALVHHAGGPRRRR